MGLSLDAFTAGTKPNTTPTNIVSSTESISELGEVDIDKLAADCAAHPLMNNNPVRMDAAAVKAMFEALR